MQALVLTADQTLELQALDRPTPGPGQVLVRLRAAALNHRELWIVKGLYPGMRLPCILGADGAGEVVDVGEGAARDWLGKAVVLYPALDWGEEYEVPGPRFRVRGMPDAGTLAEYTVVDEKYLVEKPAYLSFEQAAAIPVAGLTAWRGLTNYGSLLAGEKLLITGIGGGVAQFGLRIARAMGAEVYVTSSSPDKLAEAMANGAAGGVNYRDEDWSQQLKTLSGGIDRVLDGAPLPALDGYLKFLHVGARIVFYGATGGLRAELTLPKFFLRYIQLIGSTMGSPYEFRALLDFMAEHQLTPPVDSVYALADYAAAFATLRGGGQTGKVVVRVGEE